METPQTLKNRTVEPIVLDHLILDSEAVHGADGKYLVKSQQGWEQYFAGTGKRLPTLNEYLVAIKQLDERNDSVALGSIMQDLRESALCTGTKINYRISNLPVGDGYLDVLVKDSAWQTALQDLLQHDVEEATNILQKVSGKRPYLWTPDASGRESRPERAVWLSIDADRFYLYCNLNPISYDGRVRGVRVVGAAGARAKKTGPVVKQNVQNAIRLPTRDEILVVAKPYVAQPLWQEFARTIPERAPVSGDVLQRTADGHYMSKHSWEEFKTRLEKLY